MGFLEASLIDECHAKSFSFLLLLLYMSIIQFMSGNCDFKKILLIDKNIPFLNQILISPARI